MRLLRFGVFGFFSLIGGVTCLANPPARPPKVIIDTDFNTIGDDGQVGVMAAQLYAQGVIDLLGFTVASGNQWRDQEVADCLKALERMGIEKEVKVYVGSQYPILHDYNDYLYEEQLVGPSIDYVGAYSAPLILPADGIGEAYLCRLDVGSSEEHRCIRIGPIPIRENLPETGVRAVFVGFINHQNNDSELLCRDNRGGEAHRLTIKLHCRQSIK
jgi:hypothetical protein